MVFFDLNIPYYETDKIDADKSARKTTRLKLTVKAMELGYTGVAYNRTIKGVMSESDRCASPRFPLPSVLKLSPYLSAAVKLHRDVLNVPASAPFRQYTRLTVVADSSSQVSALNSGNPILKTYDIVSVRPMNQNAFDQACQASEVDLIAIDFSEKLPFRLKQPLVKAAIERGVYFEITYSRLIVDAHVRRQMISNAKLLVDWTRGKNLVISSAASSVTGLRGPYDVANLSTLLGLSMEHAKAAISKNCRSLISNALRKKQFYKEAIRVEPISSGEQFDSKESCLSDWLKWDPISSGEGDLLLDDMAKSFSVSKASKTVKEVLDSFPTLGLQVCGVKSTTEAAVQPHDISKNLSVEQTGVSVIVTTGVSQHQLSTTDQTSSYRTEVHNLQSQSRVTRDARVMLPDHSAVFHTSAMETEIASTCNAIVDPTQSKDIDFSAFKSNEGCGSDRILGTQDHVMEECLIVKNSKVKGDLASALHDMCMHEDFMEREQLRETIDVSVLVAADGLPVVEESYHEMNGTDDHPVVNREPPTEEVMEDHRRIEIQTEVICPSFDDCSGKGKVKPRKRRIRSRASFLFPLKRLLNLKPFKRKA